MIESHPPRRTLTHAALHFMDIPKLVSLLLFFVVLLTLLPTDPDYYWHLVTGQYIFEQRALPSSDIFSYTQYGKPWVLHEWLFQLVLYGIYASLGQIGVNVVTALLGVTALHILHGTARRITSGSMVTTFISIALFIFLVPAIIPRPQLISFVLFATFLSILLEYKYLGKDRYLFVLPLLMVVWVNSHGGYITGIVLLVLFTLCEWLTYLSRTQEDALARQRVVRLAKITVITALASAVNPEFVRHWLYPFEVIGMEANKSIAEWQSPSFNIPYFKAYLLIIVGYCLLLIYGRKKPGLTELVIPGFFVLSSFVAVRHTPLAALSLIPYISLRLHEGLDTGLNPPPIITKIKEVYRLKVSNSRQLGNLEYVFNWLLLVLFCLVFLGYYPQHHADDRTKLNAALPIGATEFVINNHISGRIYHTYHYGGYLLYKLYPEQKVFIDGRADMYGDAFIKEYRKIYTGDPDWETLFNSYNIEYVVIDRDAPIRQILLARGDFCLVYDDETNSVLVRNSPKFANIIRLYGE